MVFKENIFLPLYLVVKQYVVTVLWEGCVTLLLRSKVSTDPYSIYEAGKSLLKNYLLIAPSPPL